jgi:hypothetical protein
MHLVVVMMLGICVPSVATGFPEVDDTEPVRAGTVSSHTQDGAEAEAADAASEGASPPPAPAKATGELTDGERFFQGVWQLNEYGDLLRRRWHHRARGAGAGRSPTQGVHQAERDVARAPARSGDRG